MVVQYNTQEVNRQCAVPGSMVIYDDQVFRVSKNINGKILISRISACRVVRDLLVNIILDDHGNPVIN